MSTWTPSTRPSRSSTTRRWPGKPVIVGRNRRRGVVASCSYEARAFGVRSAMPSAQARRLCPHAVFRRRPLRPIRTRSAARIHAVFEHYTPLVEGISLDEAFLDVTGSERLFGPAAADRGRHPEPHRRRARPGLFRRRGSGEVPGQAGLGGGQAGPAGEGIVPGRGVVVIEPGEELRVPCTRCRSSRCGASARPPRPGCASLGVTTVGELAAVPADALEAAVGRAHGSHLARLARGHRRPALSNPTGSSSR